MQKLCLHIVVVRFALIFYCHHNVKAQGTHEKHVAPGTSSLTFVFDTTGSMNDDLIQVQDGAKKILDTVLKQRQKLIHNYVYVPFHDPRVGPMFSTTDPRTFQRHLSSVHVAGGGDCPEMALSGIQMALKASLPASFIYVFTDARAKDYHLEDQIINLIQEKQSSVVFVMTGDCNNRTHPGFQCYEKIAAVSFGQVFHLEKTDINKIINYVRHSITSKKVHIMYEARIHGGTSLYEIPVDKSLTELTVSLSGDRDDGNHLDISLIDPKGERVDRAQFNNEGGSIDLNNIKLVRIRDPIPGIWKIRTSSRLKSTLRIFGHSAIDFKYGFAVKLVDEIELSHPRPIAHQSTYLIVNMTGLIPPGMVTEISLVDYFGKELYSKTATVNTKNPYLYYIGPFTPPHGFFFVRVKGKDDQSYQFQRIALTAISALETVGPRAYMAERMTAIVSQPFNLTCSVVSKGEFTLYWYKGGKLLGEPLFYQYSDTAVWTFHEITKQDRGEYHCVVISPAGNHTSTTFLETEEPVPEIVFIRNESVARGSSAFLHCHTQSLNAVVQWLKKDSIIGNTAKTRLYANGTLMIRDVDLQDAGIYHCRVQTSGGRTEAVMHLDVLEAPKVHVTPKQLYFVRGQSFNISCLVDGDMPLEPKWYFKEREIIADHRKYYITYKFDLIVQKATEEDAGIYECHVSNAAGSHADNAMAQMSIPPKIRVIRDRHMIGRGDRVTLECIIVQGNPKPKITWSRAGREISSSQYITINQNKLMIQGVKDSDAGSYSCIAQNLAGRDVGVISLDVGSMPTIVPTPEIIRVNIERSVTLQCRAIGYPLPKITWRRNGTPIEKLKTEKRLKVLPDGSLLINNVQIDDQDRYTCTAENVFGRQDKTTILLITGLVSPVLGHTPPEAKLVEGEELRLSCIVVFGTPKPVLKWYKDGKPVRSSASVMIESGGSILILRKGRTEDEGRYTCVATNPAGNASLNVNVELIKQPYIEKNDRLKYAISAGKTLEIPCRVTGKPQPKVTWSFNGKPLMSDGREYEIQADNTLKIHQTSVSHSGKYICTASNVAGETKTTTDVIIFGPPIIELGQISYNSIQGNSITLPCKVRSDSTTPTITWYLNDEEFKDGRVSNDGSLTIEKVEEFHRGQFKCIAVNDVGKNEKIITLTVHTAPTIEGSDQLKVITTNVNQSIILPCPARAFPLPSRIWNYEGDRIYDGYSHGSEIRYAHDGSLEIATPQMNHAGRYTCHVSNLAGDDRITYLVKVQEPPKIISDIPGTIVLVLGLTLEIPCRAIGAPEPIITWEKDGFQIIPDDIIHTDSTGTIRIEKVQQTHHGTYRCIATNPAGRDERNTIVIIHGNEAPTILPSTLSDYTTVEGDRIELRCFANAIPSPKITWSRKGIAISDDTPRIHVNNDDTLIIDNVESDDAGHYICKASNAAGDVEKDIHLTVIIPPDIPDQDTIVTEAIVVGQPFGLYCPVFSNPLPQITWYLDDRLIEENDPNIVLSDDQRRLHILKSRVIDAGNYKCVARNPAGESAKEFQVEIIVPPKLDQTAHKIKETALENERVELKCPISGIPEPDIVWLVNGQLFQEGIAKRGVMLALEGKSIIIESAKLEHEGIYTCVATNKGGSLDFDVHLSVLTPPKLGSDELLEVIVGKGVILNCDVEQEGFQSTISWVMIGSETLPSNAQIVLAGRRLYLNETTLQNEGVYQCRVRNSAGQSTKNFTLNVLAPPIFRDQKYETNIQMTSGSILTITCFVDGHPSPTVQWLHDGQILPKNHASISDRNQKLIVQLNDNANHRYSCIASNKAGSVSREFLVQVITPPLMINADQHGSIEVIQGDAITLECPLSTSINLMEIEWFRNGQPITPDDVNLQISLDKTRLVIVNIQKEAEGTYTCVAQNSAGQATQEFDVTVIVPPNIIGKMVEHISIVEDESLELECDFEGDPIPNIYWSKDGADIGDNVQLLNEKRTALIPSVNSETAGTYRCGIMNKAGRAEKTFNVRAILKPELEDANVTALIETLANQPISLECPLAITSDANITWSKNSVPLITGYSNDIQILNGGRQFIISNVELHDQATYSCVARNKAGEASKSYKLSVIAPPTITGRGGLYKVIENNSLVLPCEVEGEPFPTITWIKDGKPALELTSVETLSQGQQLKISQADVEHRGSYLCLAQNKVGQAEIGFDVDVITRPAIAEGAKKIIEVIRNDSVVIHCPIIDKRFSGQVTWLKDYEPLKIDGRKYAMSHLSRKLHINRADLRDEGSYSCRVRNDAGESTLDYDLNVLLPPEILILDKDKNRTVVESNAVTLSCPVTGKPEPTVQWFKDGELLTQDNITKKINTGHLQGNDLKIEHVKVMNSGSYTCEAKNKAGMVEQDILLYVMTSPKIKNQEAPSEISGKSQSALTIHCQAYGRPTPTVTWLKAGRPFYHDSNVYFSANGMKLHFLSLNKNDMGRYTCIARNPAGEEKRDFTVNLLEAPTIEETNILHRMQVNEGRVAVINCPVFGSPEPSIAWLRNGQPLEATIRHAFLNGGRQLEINEISANDEARYTCIATNDIGLADLETYLQVIKSPIIAGDKQETVEMFVNEAKDLICDISGTEPIEIEWLRGGKALDFAGELHFQISSRGRILHILSAQVSDTARYVCIARNAAGDTKKIFDLHVLIPPTISETSSSSPLQTVIPGNAFTMECVVQAVPEAKITWTRNNHSIEPDHDLIYLNNNQTLMTNAAHKGLDGRYTCTATNKVGQASRDFIIKLTAPPVLEEGIQEMEVLVGEYVILSCKVLNGTGKLAIKWIIDGQEVKNGQINPNILVENRRIEIRNARLSDSGSYICVVQNEAGEARKIYELIVYEPPRFLDVTNLNPSIIVGRPLLLDCSVTGTPKPIVIWTKNGQQINETDVLFMNDHQQLHIESATENDAGRYSCVAENKPGRAEKDLIVAVLKPPQMDSQYRFLELPENEAITLTCPINDPSVEIQWTKNDIPITTSNTLQLSMSGLKLHILHGQLYDAGRYACHAWNDAGEAIAYINVVVLVPPKITGSAFRTIESVLNQTVNIECTRTGIPTPTNVWSFNGRTIFPSEKIQILNNDTLLVLKEVQVNQEGRYSCIATNKIGRAEADTFLQVIAPPRILTTIDELKVIQGQGQTIRCEVSGNPVPKVQWLRNGQPFNATVAQLSTNLHYIHFREAQVNDAGRYTCIARNRAGEHRMTTQLYVLVPPMILESERIVQVKENTTLMLDCVATGNPKPIITWKRDGQPLVTRDSRFIVTSSKASDAGRYTCEARNEAGKVSVDFDVDIFIKPRFRNLKSEVRVRNGERARLECKVDGHPEPIITWMRGGRPIEDMKNIILSPRGETMMILKSRRADSGSYSCVAKNFAGEAEASFTVTVLIAPHIEEQIDQNLRVVQGTRVIMHCPVQGNPKPRVKWLYNGIPIEDDREKILGETDLLIENSKPGDNGRYTCYAENEAGILNTNYELEIIGPPKFHRRGGVVYEVIRGKTVTMDCDVETDPKPEIHWFRGDTSLYLTENIHISPDGQQLTIRNVELSDGGKYRCKTENEAGSAEIELILKVLVPPTIDTANIIGNPLAVMGRSIYLECPVTGIPYPTVVWYKGNIPIAINDDRFIIEQNNQTLGIKEVQVSDKGQFRCVVENKGGQLEQNFNLEVLVPPQLEIVEPQKYTRREKDSIVLYCPVKEDEDSVTPTEILWYKDGRPIDGLNVPNIKITSDGKRLQIIRMSLSDAGNYSCVALNRAGESSLDFYVEILSAPHLDHSRNDQQLHVIVGRPITLWCMVSGYPLPVIRWMKNNFPVQIIEKSSLRLIDNGQGLEILEAKCEHAGIWKCEASNAAGKIEHELTLDVWTPPTVSVYPNDNIRPVGSIVTIQCHTAGNPKPSLSWSKDGQPLITNAEDIRISFNGTRLDIINLKQFHVGEYTCTSVNEVGTSSATAHVDALGSALPPIINRDNTEMSLRLPTTQTLTLICDATGKPFPEIIWYVNDVMIKQHDSNVIIGEDGRYLQVKDVTLNDNGIYRCVATNIAGKDELRYIVTIVQAPKILNGGNYHVIEGEEAQIFCHVSGTPPPVITWQRNGIDIENGLRHNVVDKMLRITDARSSDSGLYVCIATNEAGTAQQAFTLEVSVVPRIITTSPNESLIPVGSPFSLKCGVRGFPPPDIIWSLNDQVIDKDITGYSVAEDGTLFVAKPPKQPKLTFKCTAKNNAGSDSKEFIIKMISPPFVIKEGIKTINTTEGAPSLLICEIEGEISMIKWYKDDAPLVLKPNVELSPDGTQLKIHQSRLHDEGMYSCIAVNSAGNATQKQQLYVGVPPRITEKPRRIVAKSGQQAELWCEAVGIPKPHITWLKDDEALSQIALDDYSDVLKSTAFFPNVSRQDGGVYTCKAENWAGISYKDVDLIVQVPPEIHPERLNITAKVSETAILSCNTTGVPEPVVSWVKMPKADVIRSKEKYQIYGTTLHIINVVPADDGFYHCVAKSSAGQAIASRRLIVNDAKKDHKVIWVECDEFGQPMKTIFVPARGDVPEDGNSLLPWKQDVQELPQNGTNGILIRCLPESHELHRAPLAVPRFIRSPRTQKVQPGTVAHLHCSAIGQPNPHITWIRNGTFLPGMPQNSGSYSILPIQVESADDLGDYMCVAQNTVGSVTSTATLFLGQIAEKIQKRPVAILNCIYDNRISQKNILWKILNTSLNNSVETLNILLNGSLVVYDVTESNLADLFGYQCYVTNQKQITNITFLEVWDDVPRVEVSPKQVFASVNESLTLNCKVISNPLTTTIQWTKNDAKLKDSSRTRLLANNSIYITNLLLSDRAIFKCIGSNRFGKTYDDVKVIVKSLSGVMNKVKGTVNGQKLKRETILVHVKSEIEANMISMKANDIFSNQGAVAETLLGYMILASPQLAFNPNQENSFANVEFHRVIDYRFVSGETIRVYQKGFGLDGEYAQFEMTFNGRLPHFNSESYSWVDQSKEELIEQQPGMLRGNGLAILHLGNQSNIPFYWNESIVYDASKGLSIGLGRFITVKFVFWKSTYGDDILNAIAWTELIRGSCPVGYQLKGGSCTDINECECAREICHKQARCSNTIGDYICERNCPPGFKVGPQGECEDIDECTLGIHNCTGGVLCKNVRGTFLCETSVCAQGYIQDSSGHCIDVDECTKSLCGSLKCLNHLGSYTCICPTGLPTDNNGHCKESRGNLTELKLIKYDENWRVCKPGYYRINGTCQDINECIFNIPCKYKCENMQGSYKCLCPEGYKVEQNNCTDINECVYNPCAKNELCFNHLGSYECLTTPCPTNYHLENQKCMPNCQNCSNIPITIYMISVPKSIPVNTLLLRLTAYDRRSIMLRRTRFIMKSMSKFTEQLPFILKTKNGRAMLQNAESPLKAGKYKLAIRSISKLSNQVDKLSNNFIVFIAVSEYDF